MGKLCDRSCTFHEAGLCRTVSRLKLVSVTRHVVSKRRLGPADRLHRHDRMPSWTHQDSMTCGGSSLQPDVRHSPNQNIQRVGRGIDDSACPINASIDDCTVLRGCPRLWTRDPEPSHRCDQRRTLHSQFFCRAFGSAHYPIRLVQH
jgi:hypothetical protein